MFEYIGYFCFIIVGFFLGILGSGGAILSIPIIIYFFQINPVLASTYSFIIVSLVSFYGVINQIKTGHIKFYKAILFMIPSMISIFLMRKFVIHNLEDVINIFSIYIKRDKLILFILSILMLTSGVLMLYDFKFENKSSGNFLYLAIQGLIIGFITSFVGAGGGFLIVPIFILFNNFSPKEASATSLFIVAINSLMGVIGDISIINELNIYYLVISIIFALIGMFISKYFRNKISEKTLKKIFSYLIISVSFAIISNIFLSN